MAEDAFVEARVPVVVDASAATELLDGNPAWVAAFASWVSEGQMQLAPSLLRWEVANGQLRGRGLQASVVITRMERLAAVGIETADRGLAGLLETISLADRHRLTVYDALYLQLAIDVEGDLATLDTALAAAAQAEGVTVLQP